MLGAFLRVFKTKVQVDNDQLGQGDNVEYRFARIVQEIARQRIGPCSIAALV